MTVTIADITFDHVRYDAAADVLYLHAGNPALAIDFDESPEGHALRFDEAGSLVGVTIVNARELLDREGSIVLTIPERVELDRDQLEAALAA